MGVMGSGDDERANVVVVVVSLYANENHSLKLCQSKAKMVRGTKGERETRNRWLAASRRLQVILLDPPLSLEGPLLPK